MKEYIEIIRALSFDTAEQKKVVEELESLYFEYISKWWKRVNRSETYRIAADVIGLDNNLRRAASIKNIRLRSTLFRDNPLLSDVMKSEMPSEVQRDRIYDEVIVPNRFNVKAVIIAKVLQQERRSETLSKIRTLLLGFLSALAFTISILLAFILKYMKD